MLSENGKTRKSKKNKGYEKTKCPYCKREINIDEAREEGYVDKYLNVTVCECPYCNESFEIK